MNDRVLSKIKQKKLAFDRYKQSREGKDYLEYTKARNAAKSEARKAVKEYEREIAKQAKKNPKSFYKYVNTKLKTRARVGNLRTADDNVITEDGDKAETFNSFWPTFRSGLCYGFSVCLSSVICYNREPYSNG